MSGRAVVRRRVRRLVCLALFAAVLPAGAPLRAAEADELAELQAAIEARRERLASYERRERGLFDTIEAVDEAARALRRETRRAEARAQGALVARRELERRAAELAARLEATRGQLARRAVALYKAGDIGVLRWIFGPGSLANRVARVQALQLLLDQDQQLLQRAKREREQLEGARAAAAEATARHEQALARLRQRSAELEAERRTRRSLLRQVREDRARERALLNELELAARELEATLEGLRSASPVSPTARAFGALRGHLDPPVPGEVRRSFGRVVDEEYRTQTFRKGIDFAVSAGEPVYAVAAGVVRFADWFRGYGRLVILDHGDDYFTVSGHLDEIRVRVGDHVAAGDPIGTAGETGSLAGPLLYFEVRRGSEALDPAGWLRLAPPL